MANLSGLTGPPLTRSSTAGYKPKQIIPESQKTEVWHMENVDWCISMLPIFTARKINEQYNLYNGIRSTDQFKHITETYGIEGPAGKIKHVPLVRPMFNELISEMEDRNLDFSVTATDADSIAAKVAQISDELIQAIANAIQTSTTPEELDAKIDELERDYSKFQTDVEINTFNLLKNYIQRHRLDRKLIDCWIDKLVSGIEYYRVHLNRIGEDPIFEDIKATDLFHSDNNVRTVAECDWAVYINEKSPTEIIDAFGDRMKDDDRKRIEDFFDIYHKDAFYKLRPGETMDDLLGYNQVNNIASDHKLTCYHVEWKSVRKISYLESPNKHDPEFPFIKFLEDDQLYSLTSKKKKLVRERYVQDLHHGIRIGLDIYVDLGRYEHSVRSMAEPSKVRLTFNGPVFNNKIKPYSLINETRDLQDMYDIMHWHKENLIALSGVKGSFMDLSQMPDFGTGKQADNIKMWFYYRKMGAAFINTAQEGAGRNFNQFTPYDDTLGAGLSAILAMIQQIEVSASRITGVTPQRMAQIKGDAGKATTELNLQQSGMITEYLFNSHDEFVEYALNDIVNMLRVAYPEGTTGSFVSPSGKSQFYKLDDRFPQSDYGVNINTRKSDARKIEELKQNAFLMVQAGLMGADQLLTFFKKDSLPIILQEIEDGIAKRSQAVQQMQQQQSQMQQQIEMGMAQADIQKLEAQSAELQAKIKKYQDENNLEQAALDVQRTLDEGKLELDSKRVDLEAKQLEYVVNAKSAEVRNS